MSERGSFRQSRGRGGGRGGSSGTSGRGGGTGVHAEKPKKENILDLTKYMDKELVVKFNGGREDETSNATITRPLGLVVARGTLLVLISPLDGSEEIANPFNNAEEDLEP
ncbi:MAG: hypothetical protein Q9167_008128 [Letrouitia subvulpina]